MCPDRPRMGRVRTLDTAEFAAGLAEHRRPAPSKRSDKACQPPNQVTNADNTLVVGGICLAWECLVQGGTFIAWWPCPQPLFSHWSQTT